MTDTTENKYAVVGLGGVFPGSKNVSRFWRNIVDKQVFIERLPPESVEREVFFRPDVIGDSQKKNRSYTDLLAPIGEIDFDPKRFRIPPKTAEQMDGNQKLSLLAAEEAMSLGALDSVEKDRVSVVMGNSMIGATHHDHKTHFDVDIYEHYLKNHPDFNRLSDTQRSRVMGDIRNRLTEGIPMVTEDTAPGVLPNIVAARINAVFDLHGPAYVVDAACASGLAAIICGISQLRLNEADAVVCGAADRHNGEMGRIYFSGVGALSPDGSFPFDSRANGFVVGDGAGITIIKRLSDALIAGDEILAVITGFARASDGKGKAIVAPSAVWQAKTITKAWQMAGAGGDTIELIEAHGTGTKVGDQSEVAALKESFDALHAQKKQFCGLGSVKSNIGHLKSAAAIAGFAKTVMALKNKILPPTAGIETVNPALGLEGSPFYVLEEAELWTAKEHPRRAGVSAFGFGGADYHIALEEYRERDYKGAIDTGRVSVSVPASEIVDQARQGATTVSKADAVSCAEPVFFSGKDELDVVQAMERFAAKLQRSPETSHKQITAQNLFARVDDVARLGLVFESIPSLWQQLEQVKHWLPKPDGASALMAKGIAFQKGPAINPHEVAVLFPGQGSQYGDMLAPLFENYSTPNQLLNRADAVWRHLQGHTVSELLETRRSDPKTCEARLKQTENTHPAMVVSGLAVFSLLKEMGLVPGIVVGHSVGELTALIAAGRLTFADGLALVHGRGFGFLEVPADKRGTMVALRMTASDAASVLSELGSDLVVANHNGPKQAIVSGREDDIERLVAWCGQRGIGTTRLNVSHAFHSPLMTLVEARFRSVLSQTRFREGILPVMANRNSVRYGETGADVRMELSKQITGPVRFDRTIARLYAEGIRVFIEAGPGTVLTNLVRSILADKPVRVVAMDQRREKTLKTFLRSVATLFAAGVSIDPTGLVKRADAPTKSSVSNIDNKTEKPDNLSSPSLVYGGVAVGLPGAYKACFRDDNFEQLFSGHNFIERLSDEERGRMVDLSITKVVKSAKGASFKELSALNQVIQLAGKMGELNLESHYALDENDIANMSGAIAVAVAAGYEALRDAHIPLVHEYSKTVSGSKLPERWSLPKEMQAKTGVIFANGFPMVEPIIEEVSRHLSHQLGARAKGALFELYDSLIDNISDKNIRKTLLEWYVEHRSALSTSRDRESVYRFNYRLMSQIAMQANNRLAKYINARGPNFQINAACSSTATAVTLAESLIAQGKAERMIIIGGDDPTSRYALPYLGAAFLSTGACTNCGNLYEAAAPFDKRRNGMIMGAGGVGLVIESDEACRHRGIEPVASLLGTHCFNAAGHGSQLDIPRYAEELERFMVRMEAQHDLSRKEIADKLVYLSHETYTPARGGCAEAEAVALQHVFGDAYQNVEVGNTKGMTGHTMGASIEDATAAKALQFGKAPPVVNHKVPDPALKGLNLSKGKPKPFEYALRMAAGFGSQGNYILLRKRADGNARIVNPERHAAWLKAISKSDKPRLIYRGRVLAVADDHPGAIEVDRPSLSPDYRNPKSSLPNYSAKNAKVIPPVPSESPRPSAIRVTDLPGEYDDSNENIRAQVFNVISDITGYETSILDEEMDLEADLGIDTVKQATVLSTLAELLGIEEMGGFRLSEYPTIGHLISLFGGVSRPTLPPRKKDRIRVEEADPAPVPARNERIRELVFIVISEVTGYETSVLDEKMDLEADLGVDTVKQATVFSSLAEQLGLEKMESVRLSEYPTIGHLLSLFGDSPVLPTQVDQAVPLVSTPLMPSQAPAQDPPRDPPQKDALTGMVMDVVATVTGYALDMLEADMELEADLGIDTVKQATIWSLLAEKTGVDPNTDVKLSSLTTVADICDYLRQLNIQPTVNIDAPNSKGHKVSSTTASTHPEDKPRFLSRFDVMTRLRDLIETATPYPKEMLEADLRLQSDLGLHDRDKKSFEKALKKAFPLPFLWLLPDDPSLDELCDEIWRCTAGEGAQTIDAWVGRQINTLCESPLTKDVAQLAGKRIWIVGDDSAPLSQLSSRLKNEGCEPLALVLPSMHEDLPSLMEKALTGGGPDILVDLTAAVDTPHLMDVPMHKGRAAIERAMSSRFTLAKLLLNKNKIPARLLVVTAVDGAFGLGRAPGKSASPLYGLYIGFYKSIRKAWDDCRLSILDLPPTWPEEEAEASLNHIIAELTGVGLGVEVCYRSSRRYRVVAEDSSWEMAPQSGEMGWDEVVVATGGGSGITSEIVVELAKRRPAVFALIGRTPLDPDAERLVGADEESLTQEKKAIWNRLAKGGRRVTPVMVEQTFAKLMRSAAVFETLETLQTYGSRADYFEADVCDEKAIEGILAEVRQRFGPITTLIHGAGIEISQALEKKSEADFRMVHSVKTIGAYHLYRLCEADPLRRLVLLSSIAGRFGSPHQVDYAGANAFLDLLSRTDHRPGIRSVSLICSAWRDKGMAWRNSFVREHAPSIGLGFIPPAVGAALAATEIVQSNGPKEVVMHRGLADVVDADQSAVDLSPYPLVDWIEKKQGLISSTHRRFFVKRDAFLNQHRLADTPLMPAVGFMEMMAETACLIGAKRTGPFVFKNFDVLDAFKFHREQSRDVRIDIEHHKEMKASTLTVRSLFIPALKADAEIRNYCRSDIMTTVQCDPPVIPKPDLNQAKETTWSTVLDQQEKRHQDVFFGPLFNEARRAKAERRSSQIRFNDTGIETVVPLPHAQLVEPKYPLDQLIINPAFLDTLHQAGAVLAIQLTGHVYLPVGADEFAVWQAPKQDTLYRIYATLQLLTEDEARYDMAMIRTDGITMATVKGARFKRIHS